MKALVGAFNQEKALVGAFSVIIQPVVEPMDRFTAQLVTVTSVGARCGGGDGAQRGPAPDTRTHLLRVRVRVQGEPLRRHGGPAPRRRLTEQWNVACFCVSNISSNSPASFRSTHYMQDFCSNMSGSG